MKILELTNYSSGICGVWQRVKQESIELKKLGHEVKIFSSNKENGSDKIYPFQDNFEGIEIQRFSANKLGGESFMKWDFKSAMKEGLDFKPDVIIAHSYRHLHTHFALKLAKKLGSKAILVTHAPFVDPWTTRSLFSEVSVFIYDLFFGKRKLKKFNKIFHISYWEIPFLDRLGVENNRLYYSPNGIPNEFFDRGFSTPNIKKIFFLGRISPIKNIEVLINSFKEIFKVENDFSLNIIGPAETSYLRFLKDIIFSKKIKKIKFSGPIYDLNEKIKCIDKEGLFILPSKREAMPQALIEVMARGKIVISSDSYGGKEIISHRKNGFLFDKTKPGELPKLILSLNSKNIKNISLESRKKAEEFKWSNLVKKMERELKSL